MTERMAGPGDPLLHNEQKQTLQKELSHAGDLVFELQSRLTAFKALGPDNGGSGEQEKADFLEGWLRSAGVDDICHVDAPDSRVPSGRRPNLIVRIPGRSSRTLWILGHMDVVPAGEASLWTSDPWTVVRAPGDPDLIIGRGVEDNQQAVVCGCILAAALKKLDITPDLGLGLIFVSDEESGNTHGIHHIFREKPDLVREGDLVLVPDSGSEDGDFIEVAEKGILWLKVTVKGRQSHGSRPDDGKNALVAAAGMILGCAEMEHSFPERNALFSPARSTFTPTRHEANVPNINTMSGQEIFYIDCRVLPCYTLEEVIEAFRRLGKTKAERYGVEILVEPVMSEPAASPTPEDSTVVCSLKRAVREVLGRDCRCGGVGGSTVAVSFRGRGIPAAVWSRILENCHAPNESARISFALDDVKVYAHMLFTG
ncbi:M20 family metallo-hydrolase [uncultured Mailhella sp.]|uniref:M20 family metallo-hydrolase n=1 Tax=uncultured Mailhella sp. TaxID=1981031 RepID=UPI002631ACD5|nr:M20 family metallo-hydrolase [uncultured Mailhella sp.]